MTSIADQAQAQYDTMADAINKGGSVLYAPTSGAEYIIKKVADLPTTATLEADIKLRSQGSQSSVSFTNSELLSAISHTSVVKDKAVLATPSTIDGTDYILGPEYDLFNYGTPVALSGTGVVVKGLLPGDKMVNIVSFEIYGKVADTNGESDNWTVNLTDGLGGGLDSFSTDSGDPDEWLSHVSTGVGVLSGKRVLQVEVTNHGTPGDLDLLVVAKVQDVLYPLP